MKSLKNVSYRFDEYFVEVSERRLWRDNDLISLTPKSFDTLIVLLKNKGRVVEKDVLLSEVWQDTFVEESTLAQNISTLRKSLGMQSNGKPFIETVPRHGYRFAAIVKEIVDDEEIIVVGRQIRTQITTEQESYSEDNIKPSRESELVNSSSSGIKNFVGLFRRNKIGLAIASLIFLASLAAGSFLIYRGFQPESFYASKFKGTEQTKIASSGSINYTAVSPDGKYLAMVDHLGENQKLLLRQIDNSASIEVVPFKKQQFAGLTFSPDGKKIYYVVYSNGDLSQPFAVGHLYEVGVLGGVPQKVLDDIDSPVTFSPDGRRIAFIRNNLRENNSALIITNLDNVKAERNVAVRNMTEAFSTNGLSWSPDGKSIACTVFGKAVASDKIIGIITVDVETAIQSAVSEIKWNWIGQIFWLSDGSGLIFPAFNSDSGNQTDEIWMLSYPGGGAREITNGINGAAGLSIANDSNSIVAVKSNRLTSFHKTSIENVKQSERLNQNLTEYSLNEPGMSWTAADKILYGSTLNGNLDIWEMNSDGSGNKQVTAEPSAEFSPVETSDGKYIVFVSNRSGRHNLWRMSADSPGQIQLTGDNEVSSPSIAPDNQTIYYAAPGRKLSYLTLHKISLNGGESTELTSFQVAFPVVSPDGKFIACYSRDTSSENEAGRLLKLTLISTEDFRIIKQFEPVVRSGISQPGWTPDSKNILFLKENNNSSGIWRQPVENGNSQPLVDVSPDSVFRFTQAPGSGKLIYEQGSVINDVILLNNKNAEQ